MSYTQASSRFIAVLPPNGMAGISTTLGDKEARMPKASSLQGIPSIRFPRLTRARASLTGGMLLSVGVAGCGLDTQDSLLPEAVGQSQHSILNGTDVTDSERLQRGLVDVGGGCSGVLLANDWVITAGHCVDRGNQHGLAVGLLGARINSDAIYKFGDYSDPRGADLALVHLERPFTINGSTTGFSNRLYLGSPSSMVGQTVASYGRGHNKLPGNGFGRWRAGDLPVSSASGELYTADRNRAGQVTWSGDSGGPDFIWQGGVPYVTGVHSGANYRCSDPTTSASCLASATEVLSGSSVSIASMRDAMGAVLTTTWDANSRVQGMSIRSPEIAATRWGGFTDLNSTGWAQAARSADAMCYNRGFTSGRYDGHQDTARGLYGVHCDGPGTAWFDVVQSEINATGWSFSDTNAVGWAQANRAAAQLCAWRGFVGGHFNGHMLSGRFGLVCSRDGAQWFDVPSSEVNSGAWPVGDLNYVGWAQADRAALNACRARGYASGFMNGHQGPSSYGVVCIR